MAPLLWFLRGHSTDGGSCLVFLSWHLQLLLPEDGEGTFTDLSTSLRSSEVSGGHQDSRVKQLETNEVRIPLPGTTMRSTGERRWTGDTVLLVMISHHSASVVVLAVQVSRRKPILEGGHERLAPGGPGVAEQCACSNSHQSSVVFGSRGQHGGCSGRQLEN